MSTWDLPGENPIEPDVAPRWRVGTEKGPAIVSNVYGLVPKPKCLRVVHFSALKMCDVKGRRLFLLGSYFALTLLYGPNLVPLLLVGWQSPPCKLTIASEHFAGMKPLATFRATINSISMRNSILLITPCVHILSLRRRSVLEQVETRRMGSNLFPPFDSHQQAPGFDVRFRVICERNSIIILAHSRESQEATPLVLVGNFSFPIGGDSCIPVALVV